MKKLISVLLVLCLTVMLGSAVAEEDVTGTWYINRAYFQGIEMIVVSDEIQVVITIREDGTAALYSLLPGEEAISEESTWTYADGVLTMVDPQSGEDKTAKIANGEMSIEAQGVEMILTREPYTPYVQPAAVKAESMDAFCGTWYPSATFQSGMMAKMDDMAVDQRSQLVISAESMAETSVDGNVTVYEKFAVDPESGTLKAILTVDGYDVDVEFALLEDGTMLEIASYLGYELARILYAPAATAEDAA